MNEKTAKRTEARRRWPIGYDVIIDTTNRVTIKVGAFWVTANPDELSPGEWKYTVRLAGDRKILRMGGSWLTVCEALKAGANLIGQGRKS